MSKRQQSPQSQYTAPAPTPTQRLRLLAALTPAQPSIIYLRDGEVVVYRRTRSLLYQCRYKLADGTWVRQTTGKASVEHAVERVPVVVPEVVECA